MKAGVETKKSGRFWGSGAVMAWLGTEDPCIKFTGTKPGRT
jgi:hypothetical protein